METREIETEEEYNRIIVRIDELFDAPPGSPEDTELELLVSMVNKYESDHYPIDEPYPIEYARIRKEEMQPRVPIAH